MHWSQSIQRWVLFLFGCLLLAHCIYLVTVKVTHLGVIVPAVIGMSLVLCPWIFGTFQNWLQKSRWRVRLWRVGQLGVVIWVFSLFVYFGILHSLSQQIEASFQPKAIVILGSSTPNGQPSPALLERLKLGFQLAQVYPTTLVVVSGGVDFRQTVSEAQVMGHYLQGLGLASSRIVLEDQSTSTYENLLFSAHILHARGLRQDTSMLLVTSDFHTLRSERIAAKVGWLNVRSAGAKTPLYMRYNAWVREYFACLSGWFFGEF